MMAVDTMTQTEKSLLLYLETCVVDGAGFVVGARVNDTEVSIAIGWDRAGFIRFGRRMMKEMSSNPSARSSRFPPTHYIRLSEAAWDLAHRLRREKSARMIANEESKHGIPKGLTADILAPKEATV